MQPNSHAFSHFDVEPSPPAGKARGFGLLRVFGEVLAARPNLQSMLQPGHLGAGLQERAGSVRSVCLWWEVVG